MCGCLLLDAARISEDSTILWYKVWHLLSNEAHEGYQTTASKAGIIINCNRNRYPEQGRYVVEPV